MASNSTASILTIVGGVFYVIGGVVEGALLGLVSSGFGGFNFSGADSIPGVDMPSLSSSGLGSIGDLITGFGVLAGILIIIGGLLFRSETSGRRKIGGILAIIMMLIGGLVTLGGLLIGFILVAIGAYLGLTYRSNSAGMTFGLGPIGSVTLGPGSGSNSQRAPMTGSGPTNYCIKCGSQLRQGAIFCQACGERV